MVDFTQFFNPSAWGSWNQPSQSMAPKPPIAPAMGSMGASPPAGAQPGVMQAPPGGGGNPLSMLFGGGAGGGMFGGLMNKFESSPVGQKLAGLMSGGPMDIRPPAQQPQGGGMMSGISGNPMLAKFGGALMSGQNPLQSMMSNPGDFAKWMAQRQQAQPGAQANPVGNPQPPMPPMQPGPQNQMARGIQQPGMLGGLY